MRDDSFEYAEERFQNFLDCYSPWIVVDRLKTKELSEEDLFWFKVQIRDAYQAGFNEAVRIQQGQTKDGDK
jgi:hypothetical protein